MPNVDDVRAMGRELSNWGRWGPKDQLGTVNFITPEKTKAAAGCVRSGRVFSLCLPFDGTGPQSGGAGQRFNPMLFMVRDGGDVVSGALDEVMIGRGHTEEGYGWSRFTDDVWMLPSQAGTQWDSLAHCVFDGHMYNGFPAASVTSWGAKHCGIQVLKDRIATRGVLLDIPRWLGKDWLPAGHAIHGDDLAACAKAQGVEVGEGDFVLIRTGAITQRQAEGKWGDYAGGDAPGVAMDAARWIHANNLAGIAVDTWGGEVRPNEAHDVRQPFHVVALVHMGMLLGEIFNLDDLADDCAADGQYDFMFVAQPLPVTGAVGSPLNPLAIK